MAVWLRHWSRPTQPRLRLLCLPPAGGAAHLYQSWGPRLPLDVEVVGVELPGHGSRWAEPPANEMATVLNGLGTEVRSLPPLPLVVFGHSMGAIVGLELCRWLRARAAQDQAVLWQPAGLMVAGAESRDSRRTATRFAAGSDDDLREFLSQAHTPASPVLAEAALIDLVLPVLRADLALLAAYHYRAAPPLGCAVRVLTGVDDPFVLPAELFDWAAESNGDFAVRAFPSGHFFVRDAEDEVLAEVQSFLHRQTPRVEV